MELQRARIYAALLAPGLTVVLAACTSGQRGRSQAVPTPPPAAIVNPFESIARCEDLRTDGDGLLEALAARAEEPTRERAVRALGRLPLERAGAVVSSALATALADDAQRVRAAAAFALGQRADPATIDVLLVAARDADGEVRGRVVEALSRIDDERARRSVVAALSDADPMVAGLAAFGTARFPAASADAALVDRDLVACLDALSPGTDSIPARADGRWRILFALARRKAEAGRARFLELASAADARERIFAVQGLAALTPDASSLAVLRERLADPDWRVACEAATALGKHADAGSAPALAQAAGRNEPRHAAHHVRRAALDALGRSRAPEAARAALERARTDPSSSVRAAALEAGARLFGDAALASIEVAAKDPDGVVRAGAASAAGRLAPATALPVLARLLEDAVPRVATAAADALGEHAADLAARVLLHELLAAGDNGLRLSAATALVASASASDLPPLARCLDTSRGEIAPEIAASIVDAAAKAGGDGGFELLVRACTNSDPFVAARARRLASASRPGARLPDPPAPARRSSVLPPLAWLSNPRVAIDTSRGTLVFELFGDEAPFHVANLLELARAGHYEGLTFHRVVPDFVVQGGDVRGDGNGGTTWRGDALRGEFGPRPYTRGALGMPRNEDPDSGGSQLFTTHRDTPHLDGRYTLFGELREGFDVLDAIDVGDRIVRVRVLDPGRMAP